MDIMLATTDMRGFDPALRNALEEGSKTGSITPLLKEELKLTILNRRLMAGKGEIKMEEEKKPKIKCELSKDERRKKERRKEQNRRAAAKCREKKKKVSELVLQEFINEQKQKRELEQEVESLKRQKAELQRQYDDHLLMCNRTFTPTPNQTPSYDDTTTFTFPTCSVPSPYATDISEGRRDNTTPFSCGEASQYDDVFSGLSQFMYPANQPDMTSQKIPYEASNNVCNQIDHNEIILPDDFHLYQCTDAELEHMNGRQSISEYVDSNFLSH